MLIYGFIPYTDSLATDGRTALFDSVASSYYVRGCCETSLRACGAAKPGCLLAPRLAHFAAWMVIRGNTFVKCVEQLDMRYESMCGPDTCHFPSSPCPEAGEGDAPVIIAAYISASCPLCKKVCIPLYRAVTGSGPLVGRAKLILKPATAGIGDHALIAAWEQGKFWEYFLSLENENRRLDNRSVVQKAKRISCDISRFENDLYSGATERRLTGFRAEAVSNGATITPTLYIGGRMYWSYKDPQWVIDAAEYVCETLNPGTKREP